MAKLLEPVDSQATKGARKKAAQSRGSMWKITVSKSSGVSGRLVRANDAKAGKATIKIEHRNSR